MVLPSELRPGKLSALLQHDPQGSKPSLDPLHPQAAPRGPMLTSMKVLFHTRARMLKVVGCWV